MNNESTPSREQNFSLWRVWMSGVFLTLSIVLPAWAAIEILPRTKLGFERLSVGLGVAFLLWWVYGKDSINLRGALHKLFLSREYSLWAVVAVSVGVAILSLWLRFHLSPEELLRNRLLAAATSDTPVQGQREDEVMLSDGRLPGWQLRHYKAHDLRGQGLIVLDDQGGKDNVDFKADEPEHRPLLLLAQPAVRKRPFLLALRRTLATAPSHIPSALITIRECYARGERSIEVCLHTELSNLFKGPDIRVRPSSEELSNAFDSNKNWWLFVDGIDDSGSASEMVRLVREVLSYTKSHGQRVLISSRRNLFEYVLEKTVSDDFASFLDGAWVISINGLDEHGFEHRKQSFFSQNDEEARAAQRSLDILEAEAKTGSDSKDLIANIKKMALVLDGVAQLNLESKDLGTITSRRKLIASWAATRQFESHCFGELCGNDERKAAIERSWRLMTVCLGEYSHFHDSISLDRLDDEIGGINRKDNIGRDSVLYALLGTGILEPSQRDTFRINRLWAPLPPAGARSFCEHPLR